jgi:glutathione S-transferase
MIDLYSWPAPNGHKAQILVEELAIPYRLISAPPGAADAEACSAEPGAVRVAVRSRPQ